MSKFIAPKTPRNLDVRARKNFPLLDKKITNPVHIEALAYLLAYTNFGFSEIFMNSEGWPQRGRTCGVLALEDVRGAVESEFSALAESDEIHQGFAEEVQSWMKEVPKDTYAIMAEVYADLSKWLVWMVTGQTTRQVEADGRTFDLRFTDFDGIKYVVEDMDGLINTGSVERMQIRPITSVKPIHLGDNDNAVTPGPKDKWAVERWQYHGEMRGGWRLDETLGMAETPEQAYIVGASSMWPTAGTVVHDAKSNMVMEEWAKPMLAVLHGVDESIDPTLGFGDGIEITTLEAEKVIAAFTGNPAYDVTYTDKGTPAEIVNISPVGSRNLHGLLVQTLEEDEVDDINTHCVMWFDMELDTKGN